MRGAANAVAMGAPQFGHVGALLETCLSQSGQLMRAIDLVFYHNRTARVLRSIDRNLARIESRLD